MRSAAEHKRRGKFLSTQARSRRPGGAVFDRSMAGCCSVFGGLWLVSDRENTRLHGLARDGPRGGWFWGGGGVAGPALHPFGGF